MGPIIQAILSFSHFFSMHSLFVYLPISSHGKSSQSTLHKHASSRTRLRHKYKTQVSICTSVVSNHNEKEVEALLTTVNRNPNTIIQSLNNTPKRKNLNKQMKKKKKKTTILKKNNNKKKTKRKRKKMMTLSKSFRHNQGQHRLSRPRAS